MSTVKANPASGSGGGSDDVDVDEYAVVPVLLELEICLTNCPKTLHDLCRSSMNLVFMVASFE